MGLILPWTRLLSALPPVFWPLPFSPGSFLPGHLEDELILCWFLAATYHQGQFPTTTNPPRVVITTATTIHESQVPAALSIPHPLALVPKNAKLYCHQQSVTRHGYRWGFGYTSMVFLHQEKYSWFPYKSQQESQLDHRTQKGCAQPGFYPKPNNAKYH